MPRFRTEDKHGSIRKAAFGAALILALLYVFRFVNITTATAHFKSYTNSFSTIKLNVGEVLGNTTSSYFSKQTSTNTSNSTDTDSAGTEESSQSMKKVHPLISDVPPTNASWPIQNLKATAASLADKLAKLITGEGLSEDSTREFEREYANPDQAFVGDVYNVDKAMTDHKAVFDPPQYELKVTPWDPEELERKRKKEEEAAEKKRVKEEMEKKERMDEEIKRLDDEARSSSHDKHKKNKDKEKPPNPKLPHKEKESTKEEKEEKSSHKHSHQQDKRHDTGKPSGLSAMLEGLPTLFTLLNEKPAPVTSLRIDLGKLEDLSKEKEKKEEL